MKPLSIDKEEQIESMLSGTFFHVLREHGQDPQNGDFRRFITVDRQQILASLRLHPDRAVEYLRSHSAAHGPHDLAIISRGEREYVIAWMDHGHPRSIRKFSDLADSVAEHVLVNHGKY
jgi:hypothetical protein